MRYTSRGMTDAKGGKSWTMVSSWSSNGALTLCLWPPRDKPMLNQEYWKWWITQSHKLFLTGVRPINPSQAARSSMAQRQELGGKTFEKNRGSSWIEPLQSPSPPGRFTTLPVILKSVSTSNLPLLHHRNNNGCMARATGATGARNESLHLVESLDGVRQRMVLGQMTHRFFWLAAASHSSPDQFAQKRCVWLSSGRPQTTQRHGPDCSERAVHCQAWNQNDVGHHCRLNTCCCFSSGMSVLTARKGLDQFKITTSSNVSDLLVSSLLVLSQTYPNLTKFFIPAPPNTSERELMK